MQDNRYDNGFCDIIIASRIYRKWETKIMAEKRVLTLSSRGRRFGAALIDGIPKYIFLIAYCSTLSVFINDQRYSYGFGYGYGYGYDYGYYNSGSGTAVLVVSLLWLIFFGVEVFFYTKSQSIGKAIMGMQVVSSKNGKPIGIWWMLLREIIVKDACHVFLLGYIWILIDDKNRGWHDKILDTYVVDKKSVVKKVTPEASAPQPAPDPVVAPAPVAEEPVVDITPAPAPVVEMESAPEPAPVIEEE